MFIRRIVLERTRLESQLSDNTLERENFLKDVYDYILENVSILSPSDVPNYLITKEVFEAFVQHSITNLDKFQYAIAKKYIKDVVDLIMKRSVWAIRYIPNEMLNDDFFKKYNVVERINFSGANIESKIRRAFDGKTMPAEIKLFLELH